MLEDLVPENNITSGTYVGYQVDRQGSYPFSETNFQDFSRTQIDFSRALKFTLTPTLLILLILHS